jgi:energy-converting hydrogenase Eha subunit C
MQNFPNANQLSGRAIGSMFFAGFGTGWLFMALAAKQWIGFATVSGVMLGMSILFLTAFYLLRQSRRWPRVPDDPGRGRAFGWINAIQWTAVFIVAFSFAKLHIDAYVISAITAIIGLHMFPLARLFRYPLHYATGAVLVAWAAASAILAPVERMQGTAALGTGIILWLSAAVTLAVAVHAARQPVPAQSVA